MCRHHIKAKWCVQKNDEKEADATEHTTWKAFFCSVFDVFLCSKGNFVSSWKDDNARRAYFLMLYAKCNTWCTSISSFRKFNFKYASEVSTTFLRTYRVVSRPLKILFNHSVIDQKDKETFFLSSHAVNLMSHDNDWGRKRGKNFTFFDLGRVDGVLYLYQSFIGQEASGPIC